MRTRIALIAVLLVCIILEGRSADSPLKASREKALSLVKELTFDEKLSLVYGLNVTLYAGTTPAIDRLGIPELHLQDGPQGVGDQLVGVTAFPCALSVVATWNRTAMHEFGRAMGEEQLGKGTNVLLGPMVNIARIPTGGRNFESFGEDPYLAAEMAIQNVQGIQSVGVMATIKHYAMNNQEFNRTLVSANIQEQVEREIYLPAFEAAVNAGVAAIMCSYNRVNDIYACENERLLQSILKDEMGYLGYVMSDWDATHSTVDAANNGLDMEMPNGYWFGHLKDAIKAGKVPMDRLDDMVVRILTSMYYVGLIGAPPQGNINATVTTQAHALLTRQIAAESTVLLKNDPPAPGSDPLLPISTAGLTTIAVIGDDASKIPTYRGGGSGQVEAPYLITPLQGITQAVNPNVNITYAPSGDPSIPTLAAAADVTIVCVSVNENEGDDRPSLALNPADDLMIKRVLSATSNVIVVLHTPGAVLMPWIDNVPALVLAWYPGQEDGHSLADVLFGAVNPSGKLPLTFPKKNSDVPANLPQQYPGINNEEVYSEGLLVGYRWYDTLQVTPLFPFGFGLSYTTFSYDNLRLSCVHCKSGKVIRVAFDVENTGDVDGDEISQIYLQFPPSAKRPPLQLAGFVKTHLTAGLTIRPELVLTPRQMSVWDSNKGWHQVTGTFTLYAGSSSRDLPLKAVFDVTN